MVAGIDEELTRALSRFFVSRASETLGPQIEELKNVVSQLKGQMSSVEAGMAGLQTTTVSLEQALDKRVGAEQVQSLARTMSGLEEALKRKADLARVEQMQQQLKTLDGGAAELRDVMRAGSQDVKQLKAVAARSATRLDTLESSTTAELQKLHAAAQLQVDARKSAAEEIQNLGVQSASVQQELKNLREAVVEKPSMDLHKHLAATVSAAQEKITEVERLLQDNFRLQQEEQQNMQHLTARIPELEKVSKSNAERVQHLDDNVEMIGKQVIGVEQAMRDKVSFAHVGQLDGLLKAFQAQLGTIERAVHEKVGQSQISKIRSDLLATDGKITDLEQNLQDKIGSREVQQLKAMLSGFETKISGMEQGLQEKVGTGQLQQLKTLIQNIQPQITRMEQNLKEKVNTDQLQQLRNLTANLNTQIAGIEQAMHDKVGIVQLQQLKHAVSSVETKLSGFEQLMEEKIPTGDLQVLGDKVSGIERSMWEGMEMVQQLEGAISNMKVQCAHLDQAVHEKVASQDFHQVSEKVSGMSSKIASVERAVTMGSDRMQLVEDNVAQFKTVIAKMATAGRPLEPRVELTFDHRLRSQDMPQGRERSRSHDRQSVGAASYSTRSGVGPNGAHAAAPAEVVDDAAPARQISGRDCD